MKRVAILDVSYDHAKEMRDIVYAADTLIINVRDDFPAGILEAIAWEPNIILMSIQVDDEPIGLHDAIKAAYEAGIVLVAAEGNKNWFLDRFKKAMGHDRSGYYPAKYPEVKAVAGNDKRGTSYDTAIYVRGLVSDG